LPQWTPGDEIEIFHEIPGGKPEWCQCIRWSHVVPQYQEIKTSPDHVNRCRIGGEMGRRKCEAVFGDKK
jgi:hypothetical protein